MLYLLSSPSSKIEGRDPTMMRSLDLSEFISISDQMN
jgi:hypothetical protein